MNAIWTKIAVDKRTVARKTVFVSTTGQTVTPSTAGGLPTVTGGVQHTYSMQYASTITPSASPNVLAECYQVDGQYLVPIKGASV